MQFSRAVAALTTAYSLALVVSPKVLAKPCGLTRADGSVPAEVAMLTRSIGVRDALLALHVLARPGRRATLARVIADGGDAVIFGSLLADRRAARKAAAVAGSWAAVEALAHVLDSRH